MVKNKVRNVIKKKQKIEDFKKELNLNDEKLKGVVAQNNAEIDMLSFQIQDSSLTSCSYITICYHLLILSFSITFR